MVRTARPPRRPLRRLRVHHRPRRLQRLRLRRRRAALPARRRVAQARPRRGRERRVRRDAPTPSFYPYDARQARRGDRGPPERAPRRGLPAASSSRLPRRRARTGSSCSSRCRGARGGAGLPAGAAAWCPTRGRSARRWSSGVSPPFLAYGTAVYPELTAGAALAGAALLALRLDERPRRREAFVCFALLGSLPWLGTKFVPAGRRDRRSSPSRGLWRSRRRTLAVGSVEMALFSVALYVAHQRGDSTAARPRTPPTSPARPPPTPRSRAATPTAPTGSWRCSSTASTGCCAGRRLFALAFVGSGGSGARTATASRARVADVRQIELTGGLCALVLGVQLLVAAFLAPTMFGFWFPPRHLLAGAAARDPAGRAGRCATRPRTGVVLGALTLDRRRLGLRRRAALRRRARGRPARTRRSAR